MDIALLKASPALLAAFAGVLGLAVGSFLNVVIHRMPRMMRTEWKGECEEFLAEEAEAARPARPRRPQPPAAPARPRARLFRPGRFAGKGEAERLTLSHPPSRCPACRTPIAPWHNIPVLSWLWLRGRCATCALPIPVRYPLVELLTGALSAFLAWKLGFGWALAAGLVFLWTLVACAFIDLDTFLLPDRLTLPLLWLGLLVNVGGTFADLRSAVLGAAAGYLLLYTVYWSFKLLAGKEGMGYGDFKLLGAIGAWTGWQSLPLTLLVSAGAGAVIGVAGILLAGKGREARIPFGPYLAVGGLVSLLWGREAVILWIGRFPS